MTRSAGLDIPDKLDSEDMLGDWPRYLVDDLLRLVGSLCFYFYFYWVFCSAFW
jgi:hypothetical protein